MAEWGKAITGLTNQPITFQLFQKAPVGLYRHHKVEYIPVPEPIYGKDASRRQEEEGRKILAPYEADGWRGDTYTLYNGRDTVKPPGSTADDPWCRRVTFVRYLDYPMEGSERI